ncbi:hypothetical protein BKA70DRAFT_1294787 [Coprinopsis sp. MPI-PUGE-AT-0042]|nr:hypothetical protein BKA70DRAFT_1294787 [Coprinopsis sp. MPI-PUGE-AT-0042]
MTFGLLGQVIQDTSDFAYTTITGVHRLTDDTLDRSGLSAFIPPALHEVSDGVFGLTQRGIRDVGHTTGSMLKSFENRPLHAHDKEIGGNLRPQPRALHGSQMCTWCNARPCIQGHAFCSRACTSYAQNANSRCRQAEEMCDWCNSKPKVSDFDYCSRTCAQEAACEEARSRHSRRCDNGARPREFKQVSW